MIGVRRSQDSSFPIPVLLTEPIQESTIPIIPASRGMLHLKKDFDRVLTFQFNPTELNFNKRNHWELLQYVGQTGVDPIWVGGEGRTIQFNLIINKSLCSIYDYIYDGHRGIDEVAKFSDQDRQTILDFDNPRGTLDMVEMLESFQYPVGEFQTEWFKQGMVKRTDQFMPPPDLVFTFGDSFYLVCKLTELSVSHKLFNVKLIPVHTECSITLTVKENESAVVDTSTLISPKMK